MSDMIFHDNSLIIGDAMNFRIRKTTLTGNVTTFTGRDMNVDADGSLTTATFRRTAVITPDKDGNYFVVSGANYNTIRFITKGGQVLTLTKSDDSGYADGNPDVARFRSIRGMAVNSRNELFVSDYDNNRIRKITVE
jgi:hypothetical protein